MKKYFLFACVAAALVSCSSDDFLGNETGLTQGNDGAILFQSSNMKAQRATAGKAAADLLGGNFIVEGFKGAEGTDVQASDLVFDNYLVVWGENTAGKTEDNTNDWKYVGVTESSKMAAAQLTGLSRTISEQSIKYWDYSTENYAFAAYSAGTLNMISSGDPVASTSVKVTKIAAPLGNNAYTFTAANAADLAKCYFTDVTPVAKANYNKPVTLTFKNLGAKVRIGLYETIPGYAVKDVQFFADGTSTYTAVAAAEVTKKAIFAVNVYDDSHAPLHSAGDDWADGTYYDIEGTALTEGAIKKTVLTSDYYNSDGSSTYVKGTVYDGGTTYYAPEAGDDATLFLTDSNKFPEAGAITVGFPLLGTSNSTKDGYNKADVTVAPEAGSTTTTKTFGTVNYTSDVLGTTLATASMAGTAGDGYFTPVIPVSTGAALTLRVNYTLESTDGSGETIKVWGAKAVVPANFCEWQPNYAYTYIFKISDNTNGSTDKLGSTEGLFPITFDAVVADITDASEEQTTVTTVATPSVTTYQKDHAKGAEYAAGVIYVRSMKDGNPQVLTGAILYTTTDDKATEADVIDALQMGTVNGSGNVTGRNGLVLTKTDLLSTTVTTIPGVDGVDVAVSPANTAAKFTAVADKNYVFVYDYTTGAPEASELYSYDATASGVGASAPSDWSTTDNVYYTKTVVAGIITYTQVNADFVASTAETPQYYYKKYTNNNHTYAVKVIKTGTAY